MKKKYRFIFLILLLFCIGFLAVLYIFGSNSAVLNPKGIIGIKQRQLIFHTTLLMLIVVIPVLIMTFAFVWKYRDTNPKGKYSPEMDHNVIGELIWWGIPFIIITVLAVITWKKSHELDPFTPLSTDIQPLEIQVVALQWKWLFIYPKQEIASINFLQFPEKTPITFEITADAPMNSFWIPQLGGQVYAMPGVRTKLHLMANEVGSFRGSSANLSGTGFAGMTFIAKASSEADFSKWVREVQNSANALNTTVYHELAKPSEYQPMTFYTLKNKNLFEKILVQHKEK